ncbi:MAG: ferrous iron transport protein A [Candidatus Riflebacteria bacterium]|nr:ferrous iron transport protein A [Candidatus Riflebacteria bacterium]
MESSGRPGRPASLAEAPVGFRGTIRDVAGDAGTCLALLELGFTPGQRVVLVAVAPFGDPVAVSLRGTVIALRQGEARCVRL